MIRILTCQIITHTVNNLQSFSIRFLIYILFWLKYFLFAYYILNKKSSLFWANKKRKKKRKRSQHSDLRSRPTLKQQASFQTSKQRPLRQNCITSHHASLLRFTENKQSTRNTTSLKRSTWKKRKKKKSHGNHTDL